MLKQAVANGLARPFSFVCLRCELRLASPLRPGPAFSSRKHVRHYKDSSVAADRSGTPAESIAPAQRGSPADRHSARPQEDVGTQEQEARPKFRIRRQSERNYSGYQAPTRISTRQQLMHEARKAHSLKKELRKFQRAEARYLNNLKKPSKARQRGSKVLRSTLRSRGETSRRGTAKDIRVTGGDSNGPSNISKRDRPQADAATLQEVDEGTEPAGQVKKMESGVVEDNMLRATPHDSGSIAEDTGRSDTERNSQATPCSSAESTEKRKNQVARQDSTSSATQAESLVDVNTSVAGPDSSKSQDDPTSEHKRSKTAKRRTVRAKTLKEALLAARKNAEKKAQKEQKLDASLDQSINVSDLKLEAIEVPQPPVPRLSHGLDRVLFNPGVYHLRDPRSRVYNFDPYLEKIIPVNEFDFNTLGTFMTPSSDPQLAQIAQEQSKKYVGSTSSMTGVLKQFHFLLSRFRNLNLSMTSKSFPVNSNQMTIMSRSPDAILLRYRDGLYAIDADKQFDSANVLSLMGKFMERLLTVDTEAFEKHRIGQSHKLDAATRDAPEAYNYSTMGDIVVRSQLDAHDPRLPGRGIFDLKTRAVLPIRMDTKDFEWGTDYEIRDLQGQFESFEREYHDMARSTLLKYSLQVRLGRMDGIFVAYHNIKRIFGFQYLSLEEMDKILHGTMDKALGDGELLLSLQLMNKVFDKAVERFPKQTIRFHFETRETSEPFMYVFAEPVLDEEADKIQASNKQKIEEWEAKILGRTKPSSVTLTSQVSQDDAKQDVTSSQMTHGQSEPDVEHKEYPGDSLATEGVSVGDEKADETKSAQVQGEIEAESASTPDKSESGAQSDLPTTSDKVESATESKSSSTDKDSAAPEKKRTPAPLDTGRGAESHFLDTLASEAERLESSLPQTPLLALVLHAKSTVNGRKVSAPPESLRSEDAWSVKYRVAEIADARRAWRLYWQCRARRAKAYADEDSGVDKARASTSPLHKEDAFMDMLRRVAAEGRSWRELQDARDEGQPVRKWDDASGRAGE